jgi:hypothetical protein
MTGPWWCRCTSEQRACDDTWHRVADSGHETPFPAVGRQRVTRAKPNGGRGVMQLVGLERATRQAGNTVGWQRALWRQP